MKKTLSFVVLAALFVLPACSSHGAVAATVNGSDISIDHLTDGVRGFAKSKLFREQLGAQDVNLTEKGPIPTSFAAQWLVSLIQNEAIEQMAKNRKITSTGEEKKQARAQFVASGASGEAFQQLPAPLQKEIIAAAALQQALRSSLPQVSNAPALAQAYQALEADCTSKKLVAHILVASPEAAQAVIDEINGGAAFGDVSEKSSTDTGAKAQGGLLMCMDSSQWTQLVAEFRTGAEATPVGSISAPVQTQFGYHVIQVLDLTPENAQPLVAANAAAQAADPLADELAKFVKKAKITVNPRFGTLKRQGGTFNIDPPKPKKAKSRPSNPSTTTAPAAPAPTAPPTAPAPTEDSSTSSTSTP